MDNDKDASKKHILVADDDPTALKYYTRLLGLNGYRVTSVVDGLQAQDVIHVGDVDVVLSDIGMPHLNGMQLLASVGQSDQDPPVILITGNPQLDTAMQAVQGRAVAYLTKPIDSKKLLSTVSDAAKVADLARARRKASAMVAHQESQVQARTNLEQSLNNAFMSLYAAFQPIVSLSGRSIFAYESLLRSDYQDMRNPADILSAAEQLGRLNELGQRMRAATAARISTFPSDVLSFVNLHPLDLLDDALFDKRAPLTAHAHRVVLEITERSSLSDVKDVDSRLGRLRDLGYRFALDDLGAGYAGLNAFVDLNPDVVKLDMVLVRDIDKNITKKRLVHSMATACSDLRKQIVAEGVETPAERDVLRDMGIDLLQGYWFAKPQRELCDIPPERF